MVDVPLFRIKPNPTGTLIERSLVCLLAILFLYLTFYLLLGQNIDFGLIMIFFCGLMVFSVSYILIGYSNSSSCSYIFYNNRLVADIGIKKSFLYTDMHSIKQKSNFIDNILKTSTIYTGTIKIKHIKNNNQVYFFLQKKIGK